MTQVYRTSSQCLVNSCSIPSPRFHGRWSQSHLGDLQKNMYPTGCHEVQWKIKHLFRKKTRDGWWHMWNALFSPKKNCHKLSLSFLQNHPEISMRKRRLYPFVARYRRRPATNQPNSSRTATAAAGASSNVEEGETRPRLAKYVNLVDLLEWTDHPVLFYWVCSKYSIVELVLGVTDYRLTQNEGLPERRSLKKH